MKIYSIRLRDGEKECDPEAQRTGVNSNSATCLPSRSIASECFTSHFSEILFHSWVQSWVNKVQSSASVSSTDPCPSNSQQTTDPQPPGPKTLHTLQIPPDPSPPDPSRSLQTLPDPSRPLQNPPEPTRTLQNPPASTDPQDHYRPQTLLQVIQKRWIDVSSHSLKLWLDLKLEGAAAMSRLEASACCSHDLSQLLLRVNFWLRSNLIFPSQHFTEFMNH